MCRIVALVLVGVLVALAGCSDHYALGTYGYGYGGYGYASDWGAFLFSCRDGYHHGGHWGHYGGHDGYRHHHAHRYHGGYGHGGGCRW
jgi:hypothetical protein